MNRIVCSCSTRDKFNAQELNTLVLYAEHPIHSANTKIVEEYCSSMFLAQGTHSDALELILWYLHCELGTCIDQKFRIEGSESELSAACVESLPQPTEYQISCF